MSKYDEAYLGGDKTPLAPGQYGTKEVAGLRLVSYFGSKETKNQGEFRHSFLAVATKGTDGTAFLSFNLRPEWTEDSSVSLAFNLPSLSPSGQAEDARKKFYSLAVAKVVAANTPPEEAEKAAEETYKNLLTQAKISVGTIFRLQDWVGVERNPKIDLGSLVGTEFSGVVGPGLAGSSQVDSVISKSKAKKAL